MNINMTSSGNKTHVLRTIQTKDQTSKLLVGSDNKREKTQSKTINELDQENIRNTGSETKTKDDTKKADDARIANEEAYDLMINKTIPCSYWKKLAEQRQLAIVEVAKENEELYETLHSILTENEKLERMARRADLMEQMLHELLEEKFGDLGDEVEEED